MPGAGRKQQGDHEGERFHVSIGNHQSAQRSTETSAASRLFFREVGFVEIGAAGLLNFFT